VRHFSACVLFRLAALENCSCPLWPLRYSASDALALSRSYVCASTVPFASLMLAKSPRVKVAGVHNTWLVELLREEKVALIGRTF